MNTVSTVPDLLDWRAGLTPGALAARDAHSMVTYSRLAGSARRCAAGLEEWGVRRGDRVMIIAPGCTEALMAMFAVLCAGAVFVLVDSDTAAQRIADIAADSGACLAILVGADEPCDIGSPTVRLGSLLARALGPDLTNKEIRSSDLACLIYTSGSTGRPKGVMVTHANILFTVSAINDTLGYRQSDHIACLLPLTFDYGLYQVFLAMLVGADVVLASRVQKGPGMGAFVAHESMTVLPLVPAMIPALLSMMSRVGTDSSHIRMITTTGERLGHSHLAQLQSVFRDAEVFVMYGLTECKRVSIMLPCELSEHPGAVGRPLSGTSVRIVDAESETELGTGTVGELIVAGPHLTAGYWGDDALTAERFRPWGPHGERHLFTGDTASQDTAGFILLNGRADDIVKVHGMRVSLGEIEAAACEIPGVEQAVVVQQRDGGLCLHIVATIDGPSVHRALATSLEGYKLPDCIEVHRAMTVTGNGKIDRDAIVQELA